MENRGPGDLGSSHRTENTMESLQEPRTYRTGTAPSANEDKQEKELKDSDVEEDRKHLVSDSSRSGFDGEATNDVSKSPGKMAAGAVDSDAGGDRNPPDSVDERESLLKTDGGSSLRYGSV